MSPELLERIAGAARSEPNLAALRAAFPEQHFTECSEDDVSPRYRPACELEAHAIYLVTGASGHCLELTNDVGMATGILLASKVDDD
ncbi:DUF6129 family protein [Azonexus sp. R2A61]|uniref:DUF6129 family protein n=1 Tax=Azonexus sp. R2A61 TaxID=2744443 RepID=UPI001F357DCD|nr:DUF6129 family protein [Azonexus sp. R2A61]